MRHNGGNHGQKSHYIQYYSGFRIPGGQEKSPGDSCHLEKSRCKKQELAFSLFQASIDRPDHYNKSRDADAESQGKHYTIIQAF